MDPTQLIRACADDIKAEYNDLMAKLKSCESREGRCDVMKQAITGFSPLTRAHFSHIQERERVHFDFMNAIYPVIYRQHFGVPLPADAPKHDYSKNDLFAFIMAANFDLKVEDAAFSAAQVKAELERHYRLERHHPEHEELVPEDGPSREEDVLEMAVDRLARNVQFNHGNVDMGKMIKFLPRFVAGGADCVKKNDELYMRLVERYGDVVAEKAKEMYFS